MAVASEKLQAGLLRGPPAYRPRTPWSAGAALAAGVLIVGAGLLAGILVLGPATAPQGQEWPWRQDLSALATLGLWQLATVVLTLAASALAGGRVADVLALRAPAGEPAVYAKALLLMVVLQLLLGIVQFGLLKEDVYADLRPMMHLFGEQWLLALLVVGVGAPLSEELLFRGFLLSALAASRVGFWGGAVITSALWTALHAGYSPAGMVEVFVIGLYFSWLLWRTGSLRVAIVCHALYNSFLVIVLRYVPLPA